MAATVPRDKLRIALPFLLASLGACATGAGQPDPAELYGALSASDLALAVDAMQRALESHPNAEPLAWINEASGNSGSVTPLRTFVTTGGYPCRRYAERLQVDGRTGTYENTACRNDAGDWIWIE